MIIVLKAGTSEEDIGEVVGRVRAMGYVAHTIRGALRTVIGAVGDERGKEDLLSLENLECVETVQRILQPFKLASREFQREATRVRVDGVTIGGSRVVVMAGPCSVESRDQVLKLLAEAKRETGLPVITEVMEPEKVPMVAEYADILQIGARNIQNFPLLRRAAESRRPVLLKRGMATSIQEWLLSAEYILSGGHPDVILCERGIRTFETATRFTLDLNAVPVLKHLTPLPVVVDPSHGTGHWEYVESMAMAAVAAGADGLLIEVHPRPAEALSDGPQSLKPERFAELMEGVRRVARAVDRDV